MVAVEQLSVKSMTAHGGNHKRHMNRSMRENRVGTLLRKLEEKCAEKGIIFDEVDPHNTSQTCRECGHVDPKSRVERDKFVCTNCNQEFHVDINAAWNVLHKAAGTVISRRKVGPGVDKTGALEYPARLVAKPP